MPSPSATNMSERRVDRDGQAGDNHRGETYAEVRHIEEYGMSISTPITPAGDLTEWLARAEAIQPETVALRRAIHAEPELGLVLPATTAKVKEALAGLPLELREGPTTSGVIAVLKGGRPGPTVLLRGDMDALPMPEDTDLAFKSKEPGRMHACGHDSHTAMLVGAAKLLCTRQSELPGTVYFMFQPGEEGHFGAKFMLEDGIIDPLPDAAFALHIMPNGKAGVFGSRPGPLLASADVVLMRIKGKGGHASMPHDTTDPVPIACEIVTAIQAMVTRRVNVFDPAVVTIGRITAGTTNNVIPETAEIEGTIRTVSEQTRTLVHERLQELATYIALAHGATAEVEIHQGFPVTVNDARAVAHARAVVLETFGEGAWMPLPSPIMGAEDFSFVLQQVPGMMAFIGASPEGVDYHTACPCHSNRMVMNEAIMARGVAMHCALAEKFLREGFAGEH